MKNIPDSSRNSMLKVPDTARAAQAQNLVRLLYSHNSNSQEPSEIRAGKQRAKRAQ
jgi:hypothetical protein